MKIILPGGSGQVGTLLARRFFARGDDVVVLSREPKPAPWRTMAWDARTPGPFEAEIASSDVVINLAGRSVNCRYSKTHRREILESRVNSTRAVLAAIQKAPNPPKVLLQSSTATLYDHRFDAPNDEATGHVGVDATHAKDTWRFSREVAEAWERAADAVVLPGTRVVKLRSAMIMSEDRGGVFDTLLGLVRKGLGGRAGDGRQYVSFLHARDFLRAIDWLIERTHLVGAVNLAAPNPLPNAVFMAELRRAFGARLGLPATKWMLEIGAFLLRTETELVLKSRRVIPGTLLADGFQFEFPTWPSAAKDLCERWRAARRA